MLDGGVLALLLVALQLQGPPAWFAPAPHHVKGLPGSTGSSAQTRYLGTSSIWHCSLTKEEGSSEHSPGQTLLNVN